MNTEKDQNEALNKTDVSSSVLMDIDMVYPIELIKKEIINEQCKLYDTTNKEEIGFIFHKLDCLRKAQLCLELVERRINPFTNQTFNK